MKRRRLASPVHVQNIPIKEIDCPAISRKRFLPSDQSPLIKNRRSIVADTEFKDTPQNISQQIRQDINPTVAPIPINHSNQQYHSDLTDLHHD